MKKVLLIVVSALICVGVSAKDFKVTTGKASIMKEKATATVVIDFTGCTWDKDQTLEEFSGDKYDERAASALKNFIIGFNDSTKGLSVTDAADGTKYTMKVHIKNMDRKQTGLVWGQSVLSFDGDVTMTDNESGEVVFVVEINNYWGQRADFDPEDRVVKGYNELGWKIATLK